MPFKMPKFILPCLSILSWSFRGFKSFDFLKVPLPGYAIEFLDNRIDQVWKSCIGNIGKTLSAWEYVG